MARRDSDQPSHPKSDPGPPIVAPAADTPPARAETLPGTGVNAASWGTFQRRMQLRRETTCLGAMRRAMEAGDYQTALERANELVVLDPTWNEVKLLLEQLQADATKPAPIVAAAPAAVPATVPAAPAGAGASDAQDVVASLPVELAPPPAPVPAAVQIARSVRPRGHRLRGLALAAVIMLAAAFGGWLAMQPADTLARWIAPLMNGRTRAQEASRAPADPVADAPQLSTSQQDAPPLIPELSAGNVGAMPTPHSPPLKAQPAAPEPAAQQAPKPAPSARQENRAASDRGAAPTPQTDGLGTAGSTRTALLTTPAKQTTAVPQPFGSPAMRDVQSPAPATTGPASSAPTPSRASALPPIPTLEARDVGGQPALEAVAPPPREARSPAPPASPSPTAAQEREADQRAISATLGAYARAYDSLNARAVQRVWPGVDLEALGNAFEQLQSQRVVFSGCNVDIRGLHASATCRGVASYLPKVGTRERTTMSREWRFGLRKVVDTWVIDSTVVR